MLTVNQVSKHFGETAAVKDVSFSLEGAQTLALLGESGSGKSTLLRLIAGFERPDSGSIALNGQTLCQGNQFVLPELRGIGLLFQHFALFPHLTVANNVAFGLNRLSKTERRERVANALARLDLAALGNRFPNQLSGGQQQRVALARTLVTGPRLLLLDEPFSNLDIQLKEQVRFEVGQELRKLDIPAIMVTHDKDDTLAIADTIAVMKGGRLLETGTPQSLYSQPRNLFTARLFGRLTAVPLSQSAVAPPKVAYMRPENVQLSSASEGASATVVSCRYNAPGYAINATCQNVLVSLHTPQAFEPGTTVGLIFPPEHQIALNNG